MNHEPDSTHDLELPPVEEVERRLGLGSADRDDLPGLHDLNTSRIPLARLLAFSLALAVVPLHNVAVLGRFDLGSYLVLVAGVEGYCLLSWLVLRRYFARSPDFHLGTLFVWLDLLFMTWLVWATGGPRSLYWPIYFIRVADQIWISQRRAMAMALTGVALYGGLDLVIWLTGGGVDWAVEALKLILLGGMSLALAAAAGQPWDVRGKTRAARDLILQLEEQSLALDRERRRAESANRAKSDFLARMSHELRTPLNSVVGFTNVLLKNRSLGLGSRELDYLQRIRQNGLHLLTLINDILDVARIEEGRIQVEMGRVEVDELVRQTVDQLEGRTLDTPVRITAEIPDDVLPIRADEARLRQVLVNLVGNGIKFTEQGTVHVEVRADESGAARAISVSDTGIGIPRDRLVGVFEVFEQVDGGIDRRHAGTGMGLAISRSLCSLMGFDLTVDSRLGRGSTFIISIPPGSVVTAGESSSGDRHRADPGEGEP